MVGKTIGAYRILSLLGAGGMGQVYLAEDTRLSRKLALKVLAAEVASDQQRMRRFVQEARAASALSHANIAHTYELGEIEGRPFIAMEYVEGQTLSAKINRHPMSLTEIIQISLQVADALDEAHGKGITHRDIKAGNIMITPRGQVKVLDFGLAKIDKSREVVGDASTLLSTASGLLMGTISYMSPEQALGRDVDHRTDIFSLGVVMYEMATGCLPFSGGSAGETIERIVHAHPEAIARLNYSISAELERIVRKCMEKERERRYQSARDLVVDLRNWDRDTKKSERPAPQSRKHSRKSIDSLAVLPIENSSADPEMDYLSDGITGTSSTVSRSCPSCTSCLKKRRSVTKAGNLTHSRSGATLRFEPCSWDEFCSEAAECSSAQSWSIRLTGATSGARNIPALFRTSLPCKKRSQARSLLTCA